VSCGGERDPHSAGDSLFVADMSERRFEEFSDDQFVWRIFYGPEGGEVPA
jgi:hypothetical protein